MKIITQMLGNGLTAKLEGKFSYAECSSFLKETTAQLKTAAKTLVIDFEKVSYLDSSALGALLMLRERASASGKSIALSNCNGDVKDVIAISNFHKIIPII